MKNTALLGTASIIITQFILMVIFAQSTSFFYDSIEAFWSDFWKLGIFGWVSVIIACATLVLTIIFTVLKKTFLSYSFGISAGVFLGICLYMLNLMMID